MSSAAGDRAQSACEEIANSVSHGLALLLTAASLPVLVGTALQRVDGGVHAIGIGVFLTTMLLLYVSSALFHGLPDGRGKRLFERLDHAAIYLFIAGSYTPFGIANLHILTGRWMFGMVWATAVLGVLLTLTRRLSNGNLSTGLYVLFGWLVLSSALPLVAQVSSRAQLMLIAGGVAYTFGAVLFLLGARLRFAHLAWHLCVMAGSGLHVAAALR